MAVEGIHTQIGREPGVRPTLEQPELIEALKHGNIYDILRTPGVNRRDIEDYLAHQSRQFHNQVLQDYELIAGFGSVPAPELAMDILPHAGVEMAMDSSDREFLQQERVLFQTVEPEVTMHRDSEGRSRVAFQIPGENDAPSGKRGVIDIAKESLNEWGEFYNDLQWKMIDQELFRDMASKGKELEQEVQRIISLVISGQADPEFVAVAAAKAAMSKNGPLFAWKGKRILQLDREMSKATKDLVQMDPNSLGYAKEVHLAQSKTRTSQTKMQFETMDIQRIAQNAASTLEWVNNAIRMFQQMRQPINQNLNVR